MFTILDELLFTGACCLRHPEMGRGLVTHELGAIGTAPARLL
jgi:hypothetical protein